MAISHGARSPLSALGLLVLLVGCTSDHTSQNAHEYLQDIKTAVSNEFEVNEIDCSDSAYLALSMIDESDSIHYDGVCFRAMGPELLPEDFDQVQALLVRLYPSLQLVQTPSCMAEGSVVCGFSLAGADLGDYYVTVGMGAFIWSDEGEPAVPGSANEFDGTDFSIQVYLPATD